MGVVEVVEKSIQEARNEYLEEQPDQHLHHLSTDIDALWSKVDHLLYQPVLGLERPRCFYYYQGDGLEALYGFTYKYLTIEHFLGQLTRVRVGTPMAEYLAALYVQTWYPGDASLTIFADWHGKPHWSKSDSHSGHIAMWGRTMPGTKQLILNGPNGRYLGGWNYPIDAHMANVLVDLEVAFENTLERPIACTIVDSEGGGLPLGERYAAAGRNYISVLPGEHAHGLADFDLVGNWEPVKDDPQREAAFAQWANPQRADEDPRQFVLMRPLGQSDPTRIYTGQFTGLTAGDIPWLHRQRWPCNELRIRNLIHGANLNINYGYAYTETPNRTRQRAWDAAQERVAVTERQQANHQAALRHLRQRLTDLQNTYAAQRRDLQQQLARQQLEIHHRHLSQQPTIRAQQRIDRIRQQLDTTTQRFLKQQRHLLQQLNNHATCSQHLNARLQQRMALRDAIDTQTLCRERDLEKDQIMLDLQLLLANLHDWVTQFYLSPSWRNLTLEKATQMIYRKAGQVTWHDDRVEVVLEPYRYRDQQQAMEAACSRFNDAALHWRDGRRLLISVASPP